MTRFLHGDAIDCLRTLPDASVNCCITSPPYFGLRDYGVAGQIGLEATPAEYIARLVAVFAEVRRVLRDDGTLWVNIGDSYWGSGKGGGGSFARERPGWNGLTPRKGDSRNAGARKMGQAGLVDYGDASGSIPTDRDSRPIALVVSQAGMALKPKDLIGIPWMLAFALRDDGWYLRQDIIWYKPNPMPESVRDRCTKAHEYVFMLSKSARYWWDGPAIAEPYTSRPEALCVEPVTMRPKGTGHKTPHTGAVGKGGSHRTAESYPHNGRNRRSVWTLATQPTREAHFATFPLELPETCLLAGCPPDGVVLDPFAGAGTTALACLKHGRRFVGCELNQAYIEIAERRIHDRYSLLAEVVA